MERIVKKAKKTPMLRIGEDMKNSKWYYLSDKVVEFVYNKITDEDIEKGVYVKEMRVEKRSGKPVIAYLDIEKKIEENVDDVEVELENMEVDTGEIELPVVEKPKAERTRSFSRPKTERLEIIAQAIGHMTSRVVAGLADQIPAEELRETISEIYDAFAEKIESYIKSKIEEGE